MSLGSVFQIAGSGMTAESRRLEASAGNMANANVVAGNPDDVYKPQYPVFKAVQNQANHFMNEKMIAGVEVTGVYESEADPIQHYEPNNPLADADGFVYAPNISTVEEMANMISASRSYQINIEMLNTAKQLMQHTLQSLDER